VPSFSYPHTIDNGAGERITFVRRIPGKRGDRLEIENVVGQGNGPPMHIHHFQDEALTVVGGRIGYQRAGEEPTYGGPGDTALFVAGEAHKFWNAGEGELRCTGYIEPADNIEFFLGALYDSTGRNGGRPDLFEVAWLIRRYRSEFTMVELPPAVQRVVFPLVVLVGQLRGKYSRYANAPEPIRRPRP
jgi:uncharacterized cupin superfamily protein